ncbi:hypothetical protein [Azohydromonas lata]|uniref:Uncharacterized protein n=1 Tax=Azohydromonas lata TaxID=45677 RepID=A0ABU5I8A0_9BURK|nr:hypothetical protein [Azohydromonas lata]MDZ5455320.1 hypothetical protein [Azohydromonas lata]
MTKVIYRTKDGRADYAFSLERQADGEVRAYITSQPNYAGRDNSGHATHRYTDLRDDRRYICWDGSLRTEDDAKKVAAAWADRTQEYIRSGKGF